MARGRFAGRARREVMEEFRCPICKKPTRAGEKSFPFCSERCKLIDLGAWADERYRISRPAREEESEDGPPAPPAGDGDEDRP